MKLRTKKDVKPWDNVSIDEILPYNPKYTKMLILSYIFIAFFIFENINFLNIPQSYLSLIKLCVYGILAFISLYLFEDGRLKRMLNVFISVVLFFTVVEIIITSIGIVIIGFNFFDIFKLLNLSTILEFILHVLNISFYMITAFLGPFSLIVTRDPRIEKHALLIVAIFNILIVIGFLHIFSIIA